MPAAVPSVTYTARTVPKKKHRRWRIIIWDRGDVRPGAWQYTTEAEATEDMLSWERFTGADRHPVYAIGVAEMYVGQKTLRRHQLIHAIEKFLAHVQRNRLEISASLKKAKQWVPQEDEPNLD